MTTGITVIPTGTWVVDPAHSRVGFAVTHLGISTVRGEFKDFEGTLDIGEDATQFPDIAFESTKIEPLDDEEFRITGRLTIHGVTNKVVLHADVGGTELDPWGRERVGLEVTGQLSRGDYGMKLQQALGSGNLVVADTVTLALDLSATKHA